MSLNLVKTITSDKLNLSGLFWEKENYPSNSAVIFIHGFEGDFFSHKWVKMIGEKLSTNGISFLSAQNRGTGLHQELITFEGKGFYSGSHYEKLEDAYKDIDAWIDFLLQNNYENIILSGHSLGTFKITRFLFEGKNKNLVKKLILLCPFDKNYILKKAAEEMGNNIEELVKISKLEIEKGNGEKLAPYGFDEVSHSFSNFYSWAEKSEIGRMFDFSEKNYDFPILNKIKIPVKIIVGTKDEFFHPSNPENLNEAMETLLKNIPNSKGKFIQNSKHSFWGFEDDLTQELFEFVQK